MDFPLPRSRTPIQTLLLKDHLPTQRGRSPVWGSVGFSAIALVLGMVAAGEKILIRKHLGSRDSEPAITIFTLWQVAEFF